MIVLVMLRLIVHPMGGRLRWFGWTPIWIFLQREIAVPLAWMCPLDEHLVVKFFSVIA